MINKLINVNQNVLIQGCEKMIEVTEGTTIYEGYSIPGASLDNPNWMIKRILKPNDNTMVVSYANDNVFNTKIWNNRADYFAAVTDPIEIESHQYLRNGSQKTVKLGWKTDVAKSYTVISVYLDEAKTKIYKDIKDTLLVENSLEFPVRIIEPKFGEFATYQKDYYITLQVIGVDNVTAPVGVITSTPNVSSVIDYKVTLI